MTFSVGHDDRLLSPPITMNIIRLRSVGNIPVTRPKTNGTGGTGHNMAEFIDSSGAASSLEQQRQLEDVAEVRTSSEMAFVLPHDRMPAQRTARIG